MKQAEPNDIIFDFIFPINIPLILGDKVIGMVTNTGDNAENVSCEIFSSCVEAEYIQTGEKTVLCYSNKNKGE